MIIRIPATRCTSALYFAASCHSVLLAIVDARGRHIADWSWRRGERFRYVRYKAQKTDDE